MKPIFLVSSKAALSALISLAGSLLIFPATGHSQAKLPPGLQPAPSVPLDEQVIAKELAIRQRMLEQQPEKLAAAPAQIKKATADAQRLIEQNDTQGALARLSEIDPSVALEDVPSLEVQMELAFIAHHDHDSAKETLYLSRADALGEILHHRIGSGSTADDPVRVVSAFEMTDWAKSAGGSLSKLKTLTTSHGEVLQATFQRQQQNAMSPEEPVFFQLAPSVAGVLRRASDPLRPVPLDAMAPELRAGYDRAQKSRQALLADTSYDYQALTSAILPALKEADALAKGGDSKAALARLDQLSSIRPLAELPIINIQAMRLALYGGSNETAEMIAVRPFVYGILQSLAHSGDGQSPLSAVSVVAVSEEYFWIGAKQLKLKQQHLNRLDGRSYDVLTCSDPDGHDHDYFFDVTDISARLAAAAK
jgi:hypothetical protein